MIIVKVIKFLTTKKVTAWNQNLTKVFGERVMSSGPTSVLTTTSAASSTMRTPTLQPVPESLPADHVSSSNNGAGNSGSESRASASAKKKVRKILYIVSISRVFIVW